MLLCVFYTDGIGYRMVLDMCKRFQFHLGESAKIVSSEQVRAIKAFCLSEVEFARLQCKTY